MNHMTAPGVIVLIVIILCIVWYIRMSNRFKVLENQVKQALSGIEVAFTQRYDMLTKLLDVANGFVGHENRIFAELIALRRGMQPDELAAAAQRMDDVQSKISLTAENYPQLRSSDLFQQLQRGVRDAEEHLSAARRLYNSSVTTYNSAIAVFPARIVASLERRQEKPLFVAPEGRTQDVAMHIAQ